MATNGDVMGAIEVVRVAEWAQYEWLRHGFSTRAGGLSTVYSPGDLNLGFTKDDDPEPVAGNRERLVRAVAGEGAVELVTLRQVHGTFVRAVGAGEEGLRTDDGRAVVEADGLMTADAGVMLGIQVADCVPVLVADTRQRVVAGFHAGWRGTAAGIVALGVGKMMEEFGCAAEDMVGAVGPSIGGCCYTVGEEVRAAFAARFGYAGDLFSEGLRLILWEANRRQLAGAGVRADRVTVVGECTACARVDGRRKYFSHRAEKRFTGRAMGMIGVIDGVL